MSKEKSSEPVRTQPVDLVKGKKRKRAQPAKEGWSGKKGAGQLTRFDDSETEEQLKVTPKETKPEPSPEDAVSSNGTKSTSVAEPPVREPEKVYKRKKTKLAPQTTKQDRKPEQSARTKNKQHEVPRKPQQSDYIPRHILEKRDELRPIRKSLPIWSQADAIRAALIKKNILVLTGETGSGKSTQVPQFLANESWCTKCIAITQPRRVAAISLANRVADEMGSLKPSQGPAAKVGYSVRFDNATGPNTKIKFLTEGMLLQEMLRDPNMTQYSAVVVDEVHERSVNVDLILGFLRNLVANKESDVTRKDPLKVVVMSATADVESLVKFFGDSQPSADPEQNVEKPKDLDTSMVSTCYVEGRQYPVKTVYLPSPTQDWVESALKLIFQIHYKEPLPGDILVFLTGQDTIEGLEKLINDYAEGMDESVPKLLTLPLFAALPQHAQQRIFQQTPYRTRKVILATRQVQRYEYY
jgi:ATP-dependent RNA helicase DHR2